MFVVSIWVYSIVTLRSDSSFASGTLPLEKNAAVLSAWRLLASVTRLVPLRFLGA